LTAEKYLPSFNLLLENFVKVYASLLVFIGLCTWWLILNDESRRVAHEEIARQPRRLLMDIARIEARKFELRQEPIDLPGFLEHLVSIFKPQAEAKGLCFYCQIVNTLPQRVRGDEKRVGQILINLLGNALKFTTKGEIIFRIGYSCGVTTFQVIDTGPGIHKDQLQNIFQPFTQLPNENLASGSGLGLTISKILCEIMGGELDLSGISDRTAKPRSTAAIKNHSGLDRLCPDRRCTETESIPVRVNSAAAGIHLFCPADHDAGRRISSA